jgi:peptidoglycan/LPS O-acetylase OafA/YrhL
MTPKNDAGRLNEVDSLRGFAALSVMLYHFIYRYPVPDTPRMETIVYLFGYFPMLEFYAGALPVYLFFMISGFVIFITASRCTSALEFGYRRFSRLYPVYWGAISVMVLTLWLFYGNEKISLRNIVVNLTMIQQYVGIPHVSGVFWSLTVELSFYFLVAFVIRTGLMPYRNYLLLAWSVLIFIYGFFPAPNPFPWPIVWLLVLDYGHFFVFGIAVFDLWSKKQSGIHKTDPVVWILIIISIASSFIRYPMVVCAIIMAFHAIFYLAVMEKVPPLRSPVTVYLGSISYALYLEHEIIGITLMEKLAIPRAGRIIIASAVALMIAALLTRWVERPSMEWLRINRPSWAR